MIDIGSEFFPGLNSGGFGVLIKLLRRLPVDDSHGLQDRYFLFDVVGEEFATIATIENDNVVHFFFPLHLGEDSKY